MDNDNDSKYSRELEHINLSVQHLLNLTGNILDLSKIEAEKMELYLEESSLSVLLDIASVISQPLIEKNNNRFYCHFPEEEIKLYIDQTRFNQVLLNLLSNAAKFTKNGIISVRSDCTLIHGREYVNIHVEDSGIGLSKEQIDRLFRDYTQADASISSRFGGTGLGLSLSKRLLHMMEGEIYVQSQFGAGSCFTIQLPVFSAANTQIHQAGHA
jgi:signal transduction histidine kinase